jgi:hypothetical protein
MRSSDPHDLPALLAAFATEEQSVAEFFASLSSADIVHRIGDAWTPAEHLAHICIAVSAVARGFAAPRWILRLRFGANQSRASRTFATLRDDYLARLAAGAGARGRFVPPRETLSEGQAAARRDELLGRWRRVNARLRSAVQSWTERDLDRIRLPHPLLGTITAREMLFFLVYHGGHHVAAARKRLPPR